MASNGISWVETSLNITVLLPFPLSLTLAVVTEHEQLPWCHNPDASSTEHHVYSNVSVEFEAFLPMSAANLTFDWKIIENSMRRINSEMSVTGVPCYHGQSCTSSVQVCRLRNHVLQNLFHITLVRIFSQEIWCC